MTDGTAAFYDAAMRWLVLAIVIVIVVVIAVMLTRRRAPFVLGEEMAAASAREAERVARGDAGPSPLKNVQYDEARGEMRVLNPVEVPADQAIVALTREYAAADAAKQASIRNALSMDDLYTLFLFARRASVFAMRTRDAGWIESALRAVAMADAQRVDPRDIPYTLAYIHHAARRMNADTKPLFVAGAKLASGETAGMISDFIRQNPPEKDVREDWGFDELDGGFIDRGYEPYAPSRDLARMAVKLGDVIGADRYDVGSIAIAEELPPVWFGRNEATATPILALARGGATVHAKLRGDPEGAQILTLFLIELPDPADMVGANSVESDETLARFAAPLGTHLR